MRHILIYKFFEGNLFKNIEDIILFFDVNLASASKFNENRWHREDSAFPKSALREGLMNAFIHRDYSDVSGTVTISFYPNRLEI
ncbi:hypothetical protein [Flavobacterium sp. GSB-24]|uniref:hypothetical protein n=1 Tax=Flavobacterium sp. GSB-24 TaxID=2994319 RepID=UPI002493750E|nr:hypothetical protein [Flavobacterium sp. GSB-24]BDU23399.1 hypothetical protein FLGSB24_01430 [Flavobacterium sp. GSB-24]